MFGFKTPKRKNTMTTPLKTPTSVSKQRVTRTPSKTPLKTPVRGRPKAEPKTPQTVRKRLRSSKCISNFDTNEQLLTLISPYLEIVKVASQVLDGTSDAESDAFESDSSSEDEEEEEEIQKQKIKAAKNHNMDISVNAEDYFLAQSSAVHTSDRTLNRLKTPRLSQEAVDSLMENVDDCHIKEKSLLMKEYYQQFPLWSFLMRCVFRR